MQAHAAIARDRSLTGAAVASALLHMLALVLLLVGLRFEPPPEPPREATVEVVLLAPEPDAAPAKPEEEVTPVETLAREEPVVPKPPPPQLTEAPIAERSKPPPGPPKPRPQVARREAGSGPGQGAAPPAPPAPKAELSLGGGASARLGGATQGGKDAATQDEKDFLLAQILPFWLLDYRNPRFRDIIFRGHFVLRADGTLAPPFGKNDPWDPTQMVGGYERLLSREAEAQRLAIESFLRAARAAQPFRLPPDADPKTYPRAVQVHFRLGDL